MNKEKHSFCILPWIHSFVNNGGEYQVCCTGEEEKNFIRDEKGEIFKITGKQSFDEIKNSKMLKDFRLNMLNGQLPTECMRCKKTEELGGVSRRQVENDHYKNLIDEVIRKTQSDGSYQGEIYDIDYRLGNSCNLACRMCNPKSSKKWVNLHYKLSPAVQDSDYQGNIDHYLENYWAEDNGLLEEFLSKGKLAQKLHFGGGEPFLSSKLKPLLEKCIELDIAKNLVLSFNTNLTILPKDIFELFPNFNGVKLLVSLDGVFEVNDYIRYPSKFSKIDENLNLLDKNFSSWGLAEVLVSMTVQNQNILNIPSLVEYLDQFNHILPFPNLILLHYPNFLEVSNLPKKMKILGALKLGELKNNISQKEGHLSFLSALDATINLLNLRFDPVTEKERWHQFCQFNHEYDEFHQLSKPDSIKQIFKV